MDGTKMVGAALLILAAAGGAFLATKSGVFGGLAGFEPQGLSPDKDRAQRWLAAQTKASRHDDVPKREVIENGLALESGKVSELARVINRMRGAVTYEHVGPWGVGRPE